MTDTIREILTRDLCNVGYTVCKLEKEAFIIAMRSSRLVGLKNLPQSEKVAEMALLIELSMRRALHEQLSRQIAVQATIDSIYIEVGATRVNNVY